MSKKRLDIKQKDLIYQLKKKEQYRATERIYSEEYHKKKQSQDKGKK